METTDGKTGQGATEYLVLLAVVLIIALVGVALLGFFPGTASDSQIAESQIYWQSASPIAIIESAAKYYTGDSGGTRAFPYVRIRNTGSYPIRIAKLLGAGNSSASTYYTGSYVPISSGYYLAPGEEAYFAYNGAGFYPGLEMRAVYFDMIEDSGVGLPITVYGASQICNAPTDPSRGMVVMKEFGFEYIQYTEGQAITKRQIGKPLVIRCS